MTQLAIYLRWKIIPIVATTNNFICYHNILYSMSIEKVICLRCGWEWFPHTEEKPRSCANQKCRSIYWDKPRRVKKE